MNPHSTLASFLDESKIKKVCFIGNRVIVTIF